MVFTSSVELAFRRVAILKAQLSKALYLLCLAWRLQAQSNWHFEGISKGFGFEGSVEQSMVFTVFSMVFTSSIELAFRSHCDFEGSVEQSMVFTVFSIAFASSGCSKSLRL